MIESARQDEARSQRLMAMGQMAASLAHEIRNPLGSMELFCSLLKKDLTGAPDSLHLAEQIHSGIRRLEHIIANCLQFAKEITPRVREITDVRGFLEDALAALSGKLAGGSVRVDLEVTGGRIPACDSHLMQQVIINLVANAIDAVEERKQLGEPEFLPTISINSDTSNPEYWRISIRDNGVGIPEEQVRQIFDPFFSTKSGGTGLGLAIVHSIITAHRGSIEFSSEENLGTTVTITLPNKGAGESK